MISFLIFLFLYMINVCGGILLNNVGVPKYAVSGKDATLTCDYDLQDQALYAVKWYKNGLEIFSYSPGNVDNPKTTYARPGVKVALDKSDQHQVTLSNINMGSTGRYRCEVSTEAPSFATVSSYGDMIVVVTPRSGPKIHGGLARYQPGNLVNVNCTSKRSKPAADLKWFINGLQADESHLIHYPIHNTSHGLHTSTLGLRFRVDREHFLSGGDMKLKCTATIGSIYWRSNEKSAEGMKRKRNSESRSYEYNLVPDSYSLLNTNNGGIGIIINKNLHFYCYNIFILMNFFSFTR